jgi:hypothetical protein
MARLKESYRQLKSDLVNAKRSLVLAAALPKFFRQRITLKQAEEQVKRLLDTRVERFLDLARAQIYGRSASPYRHLLEHAGCAFSDLETQVRRHGLEQTLAKLAGEGVYLTSDEFKGKTEVVRGGLSFRLSPRDLERRDSSPGFVLQSSGSRNRPVETFSPLEWRALQATAEAVFFSAHDLYSCAHAVYEPIIAGRVDSLMVNGKLGIRTDRWFALKIAAHTAMEDKYHYVNATVVAKMGTWFGAGIANPQYVHLEDFKPVKDWLIEKKRQGTTCCIRTVASNATRISRMALKDGFSLKGTIFQISGEPFTQYKRRVIEATGAGAAARYGPGGGNGAALGCGNAAFIDEMHVPANALSFVENPRSLECNGRSIHPLMLTTLHLSAPRLLLNVENGDYATIITRDCGCALERSGFTQHLHTIRSFEKFTSEGMNYFGADLFELLENSLPSEFGGQPGDYQLVEEEHDDGQTLLSLLVHPDLEIPDDEKLLARLQQGLAEGSRNNRFMSRVWQNAKTFRIRREAPHASARGKILPLHIRR